MEVSLYLLFIHSFIHSWQMCCLISIRITESQSNWSWKMSLRSWSPTTTYSFRYKIVVVWWMTLEMKCGWVFQNKEFPCHSPLIVVVCKAGWDLWQTFNILVQNCIFSFLWDILIFLTLCYWRHARHKSFSISSCVLFWYCLLLIEFGFYSCRFFCSPKLSRPLLQAIVCKGKMKSGKPLVCLYLTILVAL